MFRDTATLARREAPLGPKSASTIQPSPAARNLNSSHDMRGTEELPDAEPPIVYDFGQWNEFYHETLRYHQQTRPHSRLVSDRIATFRRFMSPEVIKFLGGFVRLHPRFCTTEGWDDWASSVGEKLSERDPSAKNFTMDGLFDEMRLGKLSTGRLWGRLDELVALGEITSSDQRKYFWNAQRQGTRKRLVNLCPFIDPAHESWTQEEPDSAKLMEQLLSRIMDLESELAQLKRLTLLALINFICVVCAIGFLGSLWASVVAVVALYFAYVPERLSKAFIAILVTMTILIGPFHPSLIFLVRSFLQERKVKRNQRKKYLKAPISAHLVEPQDRQVRTSV